MLLHYFIQRGKSARTLALFAEPFCFFSPILSHERHGNGSASVSLMHGFCPAYNEYLLQKVLFYQAHGAEGSVHKDLPHILHTLRGADQTAITTWLQHAALQMDPLLAPEVRVRTNVGADTRGVRYL